MPPADAGGRSPIRQQLCAHWNILSVTLGMDSKIADDERSHFSDRLKVALKGAGLGVSPSEFIRAYNARADGAAVSIHAARKWLGGEAIPTHEKVMILSTWLGVNPGWLRFGDADIEIVVPDVIPEADISTPTLALMNDILSLPEREQCAIREIVDTFLRHYAHRSDALAK